MHGFPGVYGSQRYEEQRTNVTYTATTIAAGGTIGAWTATPVQLVASVSHDTILVRVTNIATCANATARSDVAFDLMIGSAGNEVSVATFLFGARPAYSSYVIPLRIPAGERVSGRVAAGVASRSLTWAFDYWGSNNRDTSGIPERWVIYGKTTDQAYGTAITAGNTNTYSSWTSLTTSTTYAHSLWLPMVASGTQTAITAVSYRPQFAIASTTDAATMATNNTGTFQHPWLTGNTSESLGLFATATNPVNVGLEHINYSQRPDASAVSARVMCSGTAATNTTTCAVLAAVM